MQIGVDSARSVDNKRIFVIDSDEITRAVLQFMLHDENETHELNDPAAAYAKAEHWKPDLLLVGMTLIDEMGMDILQELRTRLPDAKLIVVTESASDPKAAHCLKAGAQGTLPKPLKIENVRRKVDIALGRRTALAIPVQVM